MADAESHFRGFETSGAKHWDIDTYIARVFGHDCVGPFGAPDEGVTENIEINQVNEGDDLEWDWRIQGYRRRGNDPRPSPGQPTVYDEPTKNGPHEFLTKFRSERQREEKAKRTKNKQKLEDFLERMEHERQASQKKEEEKRRLSKRRVQGKRDRARAAAGSVFDQFMFRQREDMDRRKNNADIRDGKKPNEKGSAWAVTAAKYAVSPWVVKESALSRPGPKCRQFLERMVTDIWTRRDPEHRKPEEVGEEWWRKRATERESQLLKLAEIQRASELQRLSELRSAEEDGESALDDVASGLLSPRSP